MPIKVSIIIPVYNVEPFVEDCLQSVLCQTYNDIEVILIDDCSPDDSMRVADPLLVQLAEKYSVRTIIHPKNLGLSAARNSGVEAAEGEWVYFLDSDDEITPDCIAKLVGCVMEYRTVDFVVGGLKRVGDTLRQDYILTPRHLASNKGVRNSYFLGQWYCMAVNKLINKAFLRSSGLKFEEGLLHEDELFSFQLALAAQSMGAVADTTYIYKVRNLGTITSQPSLKNLQDLFYIHNKRIQWFLDRFSLGADIFFHTYVVNNAYAYLQTVCANQRLNISDKYGLITAMQQVLDVVQIDKTVVSRSIRLKWIIMTAPKSMAYVILRCNALVTKLRFG